MTEMTEAPASINFRVVDQDGFEYQITMRDPNNEMKLMERVGKMKLWLAEKNIVPVGKQQAGNGVLVSKAPEGFPAADPGYCTIHNTAMKERGSGNDTWFSHKVGDDWCRGE